MAEQNPAHNNPTVWNRSFETVANLLLPGLHRWSRTPQQIILLTPTQESSFFGLQPSPTGHAISDLPSLPWGKDADFILDFGIHMVGYLTFCISSVGAHMDAPCRLRLTFGESPFDVTMGMEQVQTWISTAWLPDEIINIDECPQTISIQRRYAFRYLRLQVIDTPRFKVTFSDISCECVSAIGQDHVLESVEFGNQLLEDIDHVSISTLRECMQTVFEDGPRRDRRLWMGDLRLQALANYSTLRDFKLVNRCIFQFAAVVREDGSLPACIFEKPSLSPSNDYIVDYDALFSTIVYDYVLASGDLNTAIYSGRLWCERSQGFEFIDWAKDLDKNAAEHGLLLYCLKRINILAVKLGKEAPYLEIVEKMTAAATVFLKDSVFVSGPNVQISYASAAWLVLSEAFPPTVAQEALIKTLSHPAAVKPLTPYLWHYVCEALVLVGCHDECIKIIKSYWGGMVKAGADTFWECFDAEDATASPYGDVRNNSFCHAWSCTPTFFLRGELLQTLNGKVTSKITMKELDNRWIKRSIAQLS